jgi:hypothetical protein
MSDDDPIFDAKDPWRTLHRPLPKPIYDIVTGIENIVGETLGNISADNRSMGVSVAVWTVIAMFLIENREGLKAKALEWKE